jgi:hypothetical protein
VLWVEQMLIGPFSQARYQKVQIHRLGHFYSQCTPSSRRGYSVQTETCSNNDNISSHDSCESCSAVTDSHESVTAEPHACLRTTHAVPHYIKGALSSPQGEILSTLLTPSPKLNTDLNVEVSAGTHPMLLQPKQLLATIV